MSQVLVDRHINHLIICGDPTGGSSIVPDGPRTIISLPTSTRMQTERFFWNAKQVARHVRPDVIHVIWRFGAGLVPLGLGSLGKHCLLDVRSGSIEPHTIRRKMENLWLRADRRCFRWATTVDEGLDRALRLNANAYLPHGISTALKVARTRTYDRQAIRQSLGIPARAKMGIYVGTAYQRNLNILIRGFSQATQYNQDVRLVIIGDAGNDAHLRQLVDADPRGTTVLLPHMTVDEFAPYLSASDFGVSFVPITPGFTHQQSTKILDFLAFRLPVLATATASNEAFIRTGVNGVLIKDDVESVADGVRRLAALLTSEAFQHSTKQQAETLLARYDWSVIVERTLLPLYERIRSS